MSASGKADIEEALINVRFRGPQRGHEAPVDLTVSDRQHWSTRRGLVPLHLAPLIRGNRDVKDPSL
jgi:hypothetical protein